MRRQTYNIESGNHEISKLLKTITSYLQSVLKILKQSSGAILYKTLFWEIVVPLQFYRTQLDVKYFRTAILKNNCERLLQLLSVMSLEIKIF